MNEWMDGKKETQMDRKKARKTPGRTGRGKKDDQMEGKKQ